MRNQNTHMLRAWLKQIFISRPFARIISGQLISAAGSNATAVVIPLIAVNRCSNIRHSYRTLVRPDWPR